VKLALAGLLLLAGQQQAQVERDPCSLVICGRAAAPAGIVSSLPIGSPGEQGGSRRANVAPGSRVSLDGKPVPVAPDGELLIAFDRDHGPARISR